MAIIIIALLWAGAAAGVEPMRAVVFPLYGDPQGESIGWVGEGIAESLSSQLRLSRVDVMDPEQLTEVMESMGFSRGMRLSRGSMISIAQQVNADIAVMGSFEGTEKDIGISIRVFYLKDLKLSGGISANGPLSALAQMENELAWQILTEVKREGSISREEYYKRARKIPNSAFERYIQSFSASSENDRRRLLLKAVDIYKNFPAAHFQLGTLYYRKSDCKSALPHLKLSGDSAENFMEAAFMEGTCYTQTNRPALAVETYSRIIRSSRPFEVLNNLGVAYLRGDQNSPALNAFGEARALTPDNPVISLNLAIAQQIQGDASVALSTIEEAIAAHPETGMLNFLRGVLLKKQGEEEKAESAFKEAARQGIAVEKLLAQDPKEWAQIFFNASFSEKPPAGSGQ